MTDLALGKLQFLLRTLFQFDSADLNFGIYRVLNYKRREISTFIETRLPIIVDQAFSRYAAADREKLEHRLQELRQSLSGGFDDVGNIKPPFDQLDLGKEYLDVQRQIAALSVADELKSRVYNDLYTFFNRYYEDGDFISKRRRGREETYAIPYNGEEVLLHWANKDQYYIKTDERLAAYRFHVADFHVAFEVRAAESTNNNNKSENRFYLVASSDPITWNADGKLLTINFQHRGLTEGEALTFGTKGQQDKINAQSADAILAAAPDATLKGLLMRVPQGKDTSDLLRHLLQFTRRNTLDFFIHKDLRGFLMRELDHFIKTEALRLDELLATDANALPAQLQRARATRDVAVALIGLLAQVEDFQKRLFEKKKFVLRTDYCLTLDRVPEVFWPEVLSSEAQTADWQTLYGLDEIMAKDGVLDTGLDAEFLRRHPFLMIDTRHFPDDFKWRLLSELDGMDADTDGVLFNSENFQALDLVAEKYRESITCITLDPPYNTGGDGFLYKDAYQHSSWLSLMQDRFEVCRVLLVGEGAIFVTVDDNESMNCRAVMESVFGKSQFVADIAWEKVYSPRMDAKQFSASYDHVFVFSREENWKPNLVAIDPDLSQFPHTDMAGRRYRSDPLRKWGKNSLRKDRPNLWFAISSPMGDEVWPLKPDGTEGCWRWQDTTVEARYEELDWLDKGNGNQPYLRQYADESTSRPSETIWGYEEAGSTHEAQETLKAMGMRGSFPTPKPVKLIEKIVSTSSSGNDVILDFFAGSGTTGHAVVSMNREDNGRRKYILMEMGEYFPTVLLPRLKKAVYCSEWKDGKPAGGDGISQTIKYHTLEQYEDTLNNLDVESRTAEAGQAALKYGDEYLLQYMLDFETQGSPSLLNLDALADPFGYKLHIKQGDAIKPHPVDLVETFNYLLGLTVVRLRVFDDGGREYRAVLGEKNGKRVAVVWRKSSDLTASEAALAQDKAYITDTLLPSLLGTGIVQDRLYVNSPCAVVGAEAIEPEFKRLMFGEAL